ncbi:transcriptional regulator [Candidatus Saccharibacteria bacterium RIFCSPLOWO2_01_FULL_48_13]|nr:MAG: transcriptional regulator [Candidatus Saccharibacteria bacterium RIFCSPHIGHO2_01_FULL_48_12]OGL36057.1 MAG: transcriptional regulator [Candidatus Saccharibacteria bacterium RIFCSPHIGHO2_12_FULL_48_21]OGL37499.1 MAG: transcriptional regulator [Candidatus Saccharibacteria bacterium RIFCSPLOWO2_01_FULL_48_13]
MSPRQEKILSAIVEQYAEVASPVGSSLLARAFGVSSATIRSEMAEMEKKGYISQPHTSAGRVPTDKGYRHYVNNLTGASVKTHRGRAEQAITTRVASSGVPEHTIRNTVNTLVELTHNLGIATIGDELYMSGLSNLFGQPEFMHPGQAREVANLLDNLQPWLYEVAPNEPLNVYIGHENPIGRNSGCSLIISRFRSPFSDRSYIGVLGSTRQSYRDVMALVGQAGKALEESLYA